MSLVKELKRRNVIKMAVVYVLAAWALLQVADIVMPALGIPDWGVTFVLVLLALGFPIAVIFSWVYEITPEGIRKETDVARGESITGETSAKLNYLVVGLLIVIAALLALDMFESDESVPEPADAVVAQEESPGDDESSSGDAGSTSVAVLPFVNMSPDPDNEYFSDGISEELLNVLVRIDGLRVPSRTSSFAFKGKDVDLQDIAAELEVDHVLEGSVRKAGNQVRITAQLIDVHTDSHLWSDTYDRDLEDIFAVQDEIANAIVNALQNMLSVGLSAPAESKLTGNLEAYELYLQGRYLFAQREFANLVRASELFARAVELDPGFARAWAALGGAYMLQPSYNRDRSTLDPQALDKARAAAVRALEIDPNLAEAHAVMGTLHRRTPGERHLALAAHEKAAELDPKDATVQLWLGVSLFEHGYLREALATLQIAQSLDPASPVANDWLTRINGALGNWEEMEKYAARARALGRSYQETYRAGKALMEGDIDRYLEILVHAWELAPSAYLPNFVSNIEKMAAALKDPAARPEAIEMLESLPDGFASAAWANLGMPERFLDVLAEALEVGTTSVLSRLWSPWRQSVRQHPAFLVFIRDYGLVEVWDERGWPDLCRRVGDEIECD